MRQIYNKKNQNGSIDNIFHNSKLPLLRHQSPEWDGAQCDDAGIRNTALSQPGDATAAGANARIAGALKERYGNSI